MGNNYLKTDNTSLKKEFQSDGEYQYQNYVLNNVVGTPRMVKSIKTGIELQEYQVFSYPGNTLQQDIKIYKLRSSSYSKNLVVVFNHHILNEENQKFLVRVQNMTGRLNQINGLTCVEALTVFQQALSGFIQILHHNHTPFLVSARMIGVNKAGQIRVWPNENFAINGLGGGTARSQNEMVHSIQKAISFHVGNQYKKNFSECCQHVHKLQKLNEAKSRIANMLINVNRKQILMQLIQKQKNRHHKSATRKQQKTPYKNQQRQQYFKNPQNQQNYPQNIQYDRSFKDRVNEPINKNKLAISMKDNKIYDKQKEDYKNKQQKQKNHHKIFGKIRDRLIKQKNHTHNDLNLFKNNKNDSDIVFQRSKSPEIRRNILDDQVIKKTPLSYSQIHAPQTYSPVKNKNNKNSIDDRFMYIQINQKLGQNMDQNCKFRLSTVEEKQLKKQNISNNVIPQKDIEKGYNYKLFNKDKLINKGQPSLIQINSHAGYRQMHQIKRLQAQNTRNRKYSPIKMTDKSAETIQRKITFNNNNQNMHDKCSRNQYGVQFKYNGPIQYEQIKNIQKVLKEKQFKASQNNIRNPYK